MTYLQRWALTADTFFWNTDLIQYLGKFCSMGVPRMGLHSCVAFSPSCSVTLGTPVLTFYDPFVDYEEQDSKPVIPLTAFHESKLFASFSCLQGSQQKFSLPGAQLARSVSASRGRRLHGVSEVSNLQHNKIPQKSPSESIATPQDAVSSPMCSMTTHRGGEKHWSDFVYKITCFLSVGEKRLPFHSSRNFAICIFFFKLKKPHSEQ